MYEESIQTASAAMASGQERREQGVAREMCVGIDTTCLIGSVFGCDSLRKQEEECRVKMSDINAANIACLQRLSNPGEAGDDTNEQRGGDGGHDKDVAEHFMNQFRENRQQRREEEKRMQKVGGVMLQQCHVNCDTDDRISAGGADCHDE